MTRVAIVTGGSRGIGRAAGGQAISAQADEVAVAAAFDLAAETCLMNQVGAGS